MSYAGLIIFCILSSYFFVYSNKPKSISNIISRYIFPCIVWSLIYALLTLVRKGQSWPGNHNIILNLLATPAIHLWYLPYIATCLLIINFLSKNITAKTLSIICICIVIGLLISAPIWRSFTLPSPLGQYLHATPAVFIGMLYSLKKRLNPKLFNLEYSLAAISVVIAYSYNLAGISVTYLAGFLLSMLLLRDKSLIPETPAILVISKLTYGIYLSHFLIYLVLVKFGVSGIILPFLTFAISAIFVWITQKVLPQKISKYVI